jgi:hypothetical protein
VGVASRKARNSWADFRLCARRHRNNIFEHATRNDACEPRLARREMSISQEPAVLTVLLGVSSPRLGPLCFP